MIPHSINITALKEEFAYKMRDVASSGDNYFAVTDLLDEVFGNSVTDYTPVADESKKVNEDAIFTELPSSTLMCTENKQKYVYQMTPQEYHKYATEYMAAVENVRKEYGRGTVENCEKAKTAAKAYMSNYKKSVLKSKYFSKATVQAD